MTSLVRWLPANGNTYRGELPKLPEPPADNMNAPMTVTAKIAKTPGTEVVSVLAVGGIGISVYGERAKPDTTGPATEADFQRIADRHWNRAARLIPNGTGELIAKAWPGLYRRIVEVDGEITRLWLSCNRGDQQYLETFPAFVAACRTWTQLNLQAARYVRYLDRGIRRIYSRKVKAWVYIVQSKAAVRGVRLRPRGTVYTVEEARALLTVNPGADELRTIHRAKVMFEAELSTGGVSVINYSVTPVTPKKGADQ